MKFIEHAKEGLLNLYFAKLRSVLALLGVLVGTASVVAMVLGGELATNEALRQFKSLGTDLLAITINSNSEGEAGNTLGKEENLSLKQALSLGSHHQAVLNVAPYTQLFQPILYEGKPLNAIIMGVTQNFESLVKLTIAKGRKISLIDGYNSYCVVGHDIYNAMKKISYRDPLGMQLQVGKQIFVVVGVADPWPENSFVYANIDTAILIPILASSVISKYATINNILVRLTPDADINNVETILRQELNEQVANKQVHFRSARELITKMRKQSDILTVFLGLIGSVSLLVGGIGVMNIMLVSVMERRREIGIRLAVGAKRRDIGALFLMEAIMLSLVGGSLGVIIGILIAYFIAILWNWQFTLFFWPPVAGFSVSVAVGIFFGFYPAYLASKLDPISALRTE